MDRSDDPEDGSVARVVDAVPVGVFAVGSDGRMTFWNATAERLTGWSRSEVIGSDTGQAQFVDAANASRILDELRAGRPFSGRLPGDPTGRLYFRAVPAPGNAIVGVIQDVVETAAEDEAFALLDALWENAPVGLAYFDTELRYRRVNAAVLGMSGGTSADRLGRTLAEVHGPTGTAIADLLRGVLDGGPARVDVPVEGRLWHGRGPQQDWRMYAYPVHDPRGTIVGAGLVVVDVTAVERGRKELAEVAAQRELALNRYQSLVEATSAAVWTRQADGRAVVDAPRLRAICGQSAAEQLGWGFLDAVHPDDREKVRASWEAAVASPTPAVFTCDYRLRTVEAGYRWFRTRAAPVSAGGAVVEWIGTETDVHATVRDRQRAELLAAATYAMAAEREPEGEYAALADAVVPVLADMCRIHVLTVPTRWGDDGSVTVRRGPTRAVIDTPSDAAEGTRVALPAHHPVARCARTAQPLLVDLTVESATLDAATARQRDWVRTHRVHSMIVAPVTANGTVLAVVLMLSCGDRPRFDLDDLALVAELGRRTSSAVEAATEFERNREVSLALQSAMLTEPPAHPGMEIAAIYQPGGAGLQVGGDWYDAFPLPGGDLALGVGDVVGHDLAAAAAMGQLRSMLRGLAHDTDAAPAEVVTRLDGVVCGLGVTRLTTLIYGRLAATDDGASFRWSNAGHPTPVLLGPDGRVDVLRRDVDLVLGVWPGTQRHEHVVAMPAGATLLMFTDGLFELRRDAGDDATAALRELVAAGAGLDPAALCRHLVAGSVADTGDDIVVLAVRVP